MTTPIDPLEFGNDVVKFARSRLEEDGQVMPIVLMLNDDRELNIAALDMSNELTKTLSAIGLRLMAEDVKATISVMVSETWTLSGKTAEYAMSEGITPGDHPDRQEAMMLVVETRDRLWAATCIMSEVDGKKTFEDPDFSEVSDGAFRGRFVGILAKSKEGGENSDAAA